MKSTDLVQPMAVQTAIAINGDKKIPNQTASSIDTSSIEAGFLPITSQPLSSGGQAPERADFNGMFYLSTDQRVFLQNGGVITYSTDVVNAIGGYPQNAILGYIDNSGNFGFVKSLIDDNAYNFVETPSYINGQYWEWVYFNNFKLLENRINPIGYPNFTLDFNTLPENCIWLEGSEVSRTTYSTLFGIYGTTYGAGDGSTTFNLPDFRNRAVWGASSAGYLFAGLPNITGAASVTRSYGTGASGALYYDGVQNAYIAYNNTGSLDGTILRFSASLTNSIYGASSTVQPPAIKVRVYTRYQ